MAIGGSKTRRVRGTRGFSLVEVVTAMFILTIGLVSILTLFSTAIAYLQSSQEDLVCKQKARETMEAIYTARENTQLTFDNINNTTTSPGIFLTGFQPLSAPGSDGLVGNNSSAPVEQMVYPGPDGILGTADDQIITLNNYKRQITFSPVTISGATSPDIRQLQITIQFVDSRGRTRSYTLTSMISRYR